MKYTCQIIRQQITTLYHHDIFYYLDIVFNVGKV